MGHTAADPGDEREGGMGGIVVGVDGSAHTLDALRFAIEESRYRNCPLLVVETWQLPDIAEEVGVDPYFLDDPARQRAADVPQVPGRQGPRREASAGEHAG